MQIRTWVKNILRLINPTYRVANDNRTQLGIIKSSLENLCNEVKSIQAELVRLQNPSKFHFVNDYQKHVKRLIGSSSTVDEAMALAVGGNYLEVGQVEKKNTSKSRTETRYEYYRLWLWKWTFSTCVARRI